MRFIQELSKHSLTCIIYKVSLDIHMRLENLTSYSDFQANMVMNLLHFSTKKIIVSRYMMKYIIYYLYIFLLHVFIR